MVFYITLKMSQLRVFLPRLTVALKASVTLVLLLISCFYTRAQSKDTCDYRAGVSTNLLYDAVYVPHYGFTSAPSGSLEFYPRKGKWTFGFDIEWPMWKHPEEHRYFQVNNLNLWTRRYLNGPEERRYSKWYLSGALSANRYGFATGADKGWQGEGLGLSVGGGYKWALGKHFTLDMGLALGAYYSAYDPYVWGNDATGWYYYDYYGDPSSFKKRNQRFFWAGPMRIYINIGFDFWSRNRQRRADAE